MKISIITVVHNREKTIGKALESLYTQTYRDFEHVVIDNCSTDKTLEIIESFEDQNRILVSEPDDGIYDAINKAFEKCTGDIIGFLHSDDWFATDQVLDSVASYFKQNQEVDAAFGNAAIMKKDPKKGVQRLYKSDGLTEKQLKFGVAPAHTTLFVRQNVGSEIGFYNVDFKIAGDFEYFCRLLTCKRINVGFYDQLSTFMGSSGASSPKISNFLKISGEILRACKMSGVKTNRFLIQLRYFIKIRQFFYQ
jgi:glycosyltransferase involved in cell wall biosynthesis